MKVSLFVLQFVAGQDWSHYRLPLDLNPVHYDIDLKAYLDPLDQGEYDLPQHFDGKTAIYFDVVKGNVDKEKLFT